MGKGFCIMAYIGEIRTQIGKKGQGLNKIRSISIRTDL